MSEKWERCVCHLRSLGFQTLGIMERKINYKFNFEGFIPKFIVMLYLRFFKSCKENYKSKEMLQIPSLRIETQGTALEVCHIVTSDV